MLVWLQHEKDCFDNPTTYLPYIYIYMEGKAMVVALPSIRIWKVNLIPSSVANILQSPVAVNQHIPRGPTRRFHWNCTIPFNN